MNRFRLPAILFLVAAPLATLSISGSAFAAESGDNSKLDPCALVAKAEAERIVGELKEAPKPDTGLEQERECNYATTTGAWLKVRLYSSERWGMQKGIVSEMNPAPIEGLGDEAFGLKRGTTCEIYVRKGGLILEVSSTVGPEATTQFTAAAVKQLP